MLKDISNEYAQLDISEKDIKKFARQLKNKKICFYDIPEEFRLHPIIIKAARKLGIVKTDKRGYDVITNTFFIEEIILDKNFLGEYIKKHIASSFSDFASYYEFLDGDIYENACYFQYNFSQEEIESYRIDLGKVNATALINTNIKDFSIELSEEELQQYDDLEGYKNLLKKLIGKINACNTYEEFRNIVSFFKELKFLSLNCLSDKLIYKFNVCNTREESRSIVRFFEKLKLLDLNFFLFNFIFSDKEKAFDIIIQYISDGGDSYNLIRSICSIYEPEKVLEAFKCNKNQTNKLKKHIKTLSSKEWQFCYSSYFDEKTHFFCYEIKGHYDIKNQVFPTVKIYRYFETFQELADYLGNDLSSCDLSKAILPDVDFSIYKTNEYTKLPIKSSGELEYFVYKGYDRKKECFIVRQSWVNSNNQIIKEYENSFKYFFDFVFFLDNDLSNADLLFCDGLDNLYDVSNINFKGAKLRSVVLDIIGSKYQLITIDKTKAESFLPVLKNEEETYLALVSKRDIYDEEENITNQKVYYISDLHLIHRIINAHCKSENDAIYTIQRIIDNLLSEVNRCKKNIILIGGDTSSSFKLFNLFVQLLRKSIDEIHLDAQVIFLLGNHELWEFPSYSFAEIIQKYEIVLNKHNMYLLQNEIIFKDDDNIMKKITTYELLSESKETIRKQLKCARIILFGGLAFSSYNEEFNANYGLYRETINRKQEIDESKTFEGLYNIVCEVLSDRNVIIFTHTLQKDWCYYNNQQPGFIYVSGHTHRNYFYDDGEYRIYADNQIGYRNENPRFKYFYLNGEYDWFSEYADGIHQITKDDYINFYRGKNLMMQFTRDINILYMLKKNGYYCFIHQSKGKQLTILNGGNLKKLDMKDVNYYYDRMDTAIAFIKNPLDKFTSIQKQIANEVKAIGGSGTIHGAIIDIDFFNHIYVNPHNLAITGYWALNIIHKQVFPTIPDLLKLNCPLLYANYTKLLKDKADSVIAVRVNIKEESSNLANIYLDTDIYRASREIKKMQKLNSNILSTWYEPGNKALK